MRNMLYVRFLTFVFTRTRICIRIYAVSSKNFLIFLYYDYLFIFFFWVECD